MITGCSSGIGLELAKRLYRSDFRVAATAREQSLAKVRQAGLEEHETFRLLPLDITQPEQRQSVVQQIESLWGGVDIIINNAGISYRAVAEHMTDEEETHQLQTNYLGPMALIRLVLPGMRAKCEGRIINISSVGGMMAMPTMSAYSASKFALEGASEALWYELRPWNIKVTLMQPGFINSNSYSRVYYSHTASQCSIDTQDPYCQYYSDMAPFVEKLMKSSRTTAEQMAKKIEKVIFDSDPPLRVPSTRDALLFFWLRRLLPRWIYHRVLYKNLPGVKGWVKRVPCSNK